LDIEIAVNGEKRQVLEGSSVAELITFLGLSPERIAVEYNLKILKRDRWQTTRLKGGDRVEIVHFVGGGENRFCRYDDIHK
jgi:thiamine biosynthesis protein ThiS